ncbi:hypothetical protein HMPREF9348_01457 [Escherichia coli MS 145-7]|nr:hypothetical protein HMPREF9348_01457 [Escherichia coli MS 145-7]
MVVTISPIRKRAVWRWASTTNCRRCAVKARHDQVYETVRRYGHESGEIWHRMQKNLPGDLAIQGR